MGIPSRLTETRWKQCIVPQYLMLVLTWKGSGPHYTLACCREAQLLGLAGAVCTGCLNPAVQTLRNSEGSERNAVVTEIVGFQVDLKANIHLDAQWRSLKGDVIMA